MGIVEDAEPVFCHLYDPSTDRYFVNGVWMTVEEALNLRPTPERPTKFRMAQAALRDNLQSASCKDS